MAMVKFWRGKTAPTTRDADTLYFATEEQKIYLGSSYIADATDLTSVNAAIQALQNAGYQNKDDVEALIAAEIKNYSTTEQMNAAIAAATADMATNASVDAKLDNYNDKEAQTAIDDAQDKALTDYKAEMVTALAGKETVGAAAAVLGSDADTVDSMTVYGVKKYIDQEIGITTGAGYATTKYVDDKIAGLDADITSAPVETGKGIQVNVTELDGKITEVVVSGNYDEAYDAKGAAVAAETAAKGYADQKLLDFENAYIKADDNGTIDKLNEIAAWIADDEAGAVKIISDVATNATNIKNIQDSAVMNSGITATKVGNYDATKSTVDANKATWDKAGTAVQPADLGDLAGKSTVTKDELDGSIYDMILEGTFAKAAIDNETTGLAAAHTKAQQGIDDAAAALAKANEKATLAEAKTAIQGSTTATVADVVAAVNKLADGQATTDGALRTANSNINELFAALTWIEG